MLTNSKIIGLASILALSIVGAKVFGDCYFTQNQSCPGLSVTPDCSTVSPVTGCVGSMNIFEVESIDTCLDGSSGFYGSIQGYEQCAAEPLTACGYYYGCLPGFDNNYNPICVDDTSIAIPIPVTPLYADDTSPPCAVI